MRNLREQVARVITDKLTETAVMLPTRRVVVTNDVADTAIATVLDAVLAFLREDGSDWDCLWAADRVEAELMDDVSPPAPTIA